jgi:hypothetical protein
LTATQLAQRKRPQGSAPNRFKYLIPLLHVIGTVASPPVLSVGLPDSSVAIQAKALPSVEVY